MLAWDRRTQLPNCHEEQPDPTAEESIPSSRRNFGRRAVGPWVVGQYQDKENVRFVVVEDMTADSLTKVIKYHVEIGRW